MMFENRHATKDYSVYYREFWPTEDRSRDLKNLIVPSANSAIPDGVELWTLLEGYPGMKRIILGSNTTNGLPNRGYIDIYISCEKMAAWYLRNASETDQDGASQLWLMPQKLPVSTANDTTSAEFEQGPMIVFYVLDQDYAIPTAASSSLFVEGKMIKWCTLWRDMQNTKAVQTDTQWSLTA